MSSQNGTALTVIRLWQVLDLDIGSSMGAVVNAYVLYYERYIRSGKIGIPAGIIGTMVGTTLPGESGSLL